MLRRLQRDTLGATAVEFALIAPIVIMFLIGTIDYGLVLARYHTLEEAARRAARQALIGEPLSDSVNYNSADEKVVCNQTECVGATEITGYNTEWAKIVAAAKQVYPSISGANITVTYTNSGLINEASVCLVVPVVTVKISGVDKDYFFLSAFDGSDYGEISASQVGGSVVPSNNCA